MDAEKAAGPKTENAALVGLSSRMQQAIEDQIVALSGGMNQCLEIAREIPVEDDPDGRRRAGEYKDAVKLTTATAELLAALGKLKGGFRHDYHVVREDDRLVPKFNSVGWQGKEADLLTEAQFDLLDEKAQVDYIRWINGRPPRFSGWKHPTPFMEAFKDDPAATPLPPEK